MSNSYVPLMKGFVKLEIVLLKLFIVTLCLPILHSRNRILSLYAAVNPTSSEWCKYFDVFLHFCSSFCANETFNVKFKDWQLYSSGLLSTSFPIDHEDSNRIRVIKGALFSRSLPTPFVTSAQLAGLSEDVMSDVLDVEPDDVWTDTQFVEFVSGKHIHGMEVPLSHRYGGHQFGIWAGQLGDGRAHLIGEYVSQCDGRRWELQLKGSGKTPYSRDGDGRAVLHSSVREFLASEAMYHLGIPTSRAAALVVSNDLVKRDQFYNGHIRKERTAIVLRLAASWFRIGSFELLARDGEIDLLKQLCDFVIKNHFQELSSSVSNRRYARFFEAVMKRVAVTTALWQSVGFAHGVLSTDNVSILGLTIDYGPFRFSDEFDKDMVPNFSDDERRYSYSRQPEVMKDNLHHLLTALSSLMTSEEYKDSENVLKRYKAVYHREYILAFQRKLGLSGFEVDDCVETLISQLLSIMADQKADFTATFRQLSDIPLRALLRMKSKNVERLPWALQQIVQHPSFDGWLLRYTQHLKLAGVLDKERRLIMQHANPHYVLRNWMAQQAIDRAETNDFSVIQSLLTILKRPFEKQSMAELMGYSSRPPLWSRNITISCSS